MPYNYVDIRNATSVNFTKNVVDIRKPDGTKLAGTSLSLENSNNSVIERNDFIANWATHDTIRMYTNSHNVTVRYNYFANVSFGGYDFFVKESMNHIFDYNYYDFNPNATDNNLDGVLDTPLLLNGIMTGWGPRHLVYDQHPLANPYDILNFTISNYDYNNETGTVEVSWTGYDIREVSQFNFSLFMDNGSLWDKIATGDDGTVSFNTNSITNGLHLFKLEAATYVWSINRTFTKNIEFSMIIDNENPTLITTEPSTSETVIPDTVTVTTVIVTTTNNNTAISTFTTTVFNSNSAGLDTLTLVFLPVATLTAVYRCQKRK